MGQWEYKFITTTCSKAKSGIDVVKWVDGIEIQYSFPINEALSELGKDSWELVQVLTRESDDNGQHTSCAVYILKHFIDEDYMGETSSTLFILRAPGPIPPG